MKHVGSPVMGAAVVCLALVGCGRATGPTRVPVYGKVSTQEPEKLSGTISFVPAEDRAGPGAVTSLVEGGYRFDAENGPLAGPHLVTIQRTIAKPNFGAAKNGSAASKQQMEWKKSADVPTSKPYQLDFSLD